MSWLSRLVNVFRRDRLDRDLEDEIAFHIAERTEEFTRRGTPPPEAEQKSRFRFGNELLLRESIREVKLYSRLEAIAQDIAFGLRLLRKNAVVTAAAVLSLALAIGACTAAFSLIDALILRPLPVRDPHSLVYVAFRAASAPADQSSFNYPLFERLRDASGAQAQLFGMSWLGETPGIESASLSGWSVFSGAGQNLHVRVPGRAVDASEPYYLPVSPNFFQTMLIRLLDGRDFEALDAQEESSAAVIVNESFAPRYFPGEKPLGLRFFSVYGDGNLVAREIVGIARDAKYNSLREAPPPTVYYPARPEGSASVQVRTNLEPGALAALLRRELPGIHPAFRITGMTPQSMLVDNTMVRERLLALLSAFFSIVAVVLVAVGLYGVLSYSVVQRTREIGIRLALGARPAKVLALVISEAGLMVVLGLGAGLATGMAAARLARTLLYGVEPSDWSSIAGPLVCLLLACVLSALPPALRATRVDPITALGYE